MPVDPVPGSRPAGVLPLPVGTTSVYCRIAELPGGVNLRGDPEAVGASAQTATQAVSRARFTVIMLPAK